MSSHSTHPQVNHKLWNLIDTCQNDGSIDLGDAKQIWAEAMADGVFTEVERVTIEHAIKTFRFTKGAREYLESNLKFH